MLAYALISFCLQGVPHTVELLNNSKGMSLTKVETQITFKGLKPLVLLSFEGDYFSVHFDIWADLARLDKLGLARWISIKRSALLFPRFSELRTIMETR